jgi:hypothetical protein
MRFILTGLLAVFCFCCETKDRMYLNFDTFDEFTSLSLKAYIHDENDCGEWGGHEEMIQIGRVNDTLKFFYTRDSTKCTIREIRVKPLPPNVKIRYKGQLTREMQELVYGYINELYFYKPERLGVSNAPDRYEIEFSSKYHNKELKIYPVIDWPNYVELRTKLIGD